jgi:signal transduction histidine kinase
MDALIDDILELARHGRSVLDREPLSLEAVAQHAWANVATDDVTLEIEGALSFYGDEARTQELLENLLNNACEHADPETITIGSLADETGFFVADDGPGIAEDQRDDVFRPGFSTQTDGTGFGLSIVEEIAEGHRWDVVVTDSDDGGARFEITGVERCEE